MEIVTKIAPIALALIMLGLGLGLKIDDFKRVITNPKDFTIGIVCQLILLPIVCLLYTSPSPRDRTRSRMPSSA